MARVLSRDSAPLKARAAVRGPPRIGWFRVNWLLLIVMRHKGYRCNQLNELSRSTPRTNEVRRILSFFYPPAEISGQRLVRAHNTFERRLGWNAAVHNHALQREGVLADVVVVLASFGTKCLASLDGVGIGTLGVGGGYDVESC